MSSLLCRLLGHRWRWVGWAYRARTISDTEVFECTRCSTISVQQFGG